MVDTATTGITILGTEGNDFFYGADTDDYYDLLGGNDRVIENNGNDTYVGGKGNDIISESSGDDTYIFNIGDGQDIIYDNNGDDTIIFGDGINLTNVSFSRVSNNVIIGITGTTDRITISNWFFDDYRAIETIQFSDGISLTKQEVEGIISGTAILGSNNSDNLIGNELDNTITAFDGDDVLDGGIGIDTLIGGLGNDVYHVDNTGDLIIENVDEGNDLVYSNVSYSLTDNVENLTLTGIDLINGTGNDLDNVITGNVADNFLDGMSGNDTYTAGQGNDTISDLTGNDIYNFNLGDGQDVIYDSDGTDIIKFGAGITQEDLEFSRDGDNLAINFKNNTDKITVNNWYVDSTYKIERIEFADSTYLTSEEIDIPTILGTDNNDILFGLLKDNVIDGKAGNDIITDLFGNDTIYGGSGNDEIIDLIGNDFIYAGDDQDKVFDFVGNDFLDLGSGDDLLHDFLGNDTIIGGIGNDAIHDYSGSDIYLINKGDGRDTIFDMGLKSDIDKVIFDQNVKKEDIALFMKGNDLIISYGNNDELVIKNQSHSKKGIEIFELADGQFLTDDDISLIVQNMAGYAKKEHIAFKNIDDVSSNSDLMNIVISSWHS